MYNYQHSSSIALLKNKRLMSVSIKKTNALFVASKRPVVMVKQHGVKPWLQWGMPIDCIENSALSNYKAYDDDSRELLTACNSSCYSSLSQTLSCLLLSL